MRHVVYPILLIPFLLVPWWLKEPGYKQASYWPNKPEYSLSSIRRVSGHTIYVNACQRFYIECKIYACKFNYFSLSTYGPLVTIWRRLSGKGIHSHYKSETVWRLSQAYYGNSYTKTTVSPQWIQKTIYRKISNIRRTLVGNKIVDHSYVVGASPVGTAPTTSSFST